MGLLDDAIRDHLELKRLRGADPGEVAREQREALEPDLRGDPVEDEDQLATAVEDLGAEDDRETLPVRATPAVTPTSSADPVEARQSPLDTDSANVAEETAELDMQSVLNEDKGGAAEDDSIGVTPGGSGDATQPLAPLNEDQLEWEVPGEASGEMPLDAGQNDPSVGDHGP